MIELHRVTSETDIKLSLVPGSTEASSINTSIPFLDHMLSHIAKHGQMQINIEVKGDIEVDYHHTVEDVGIVLGEAIDKATADMRGVTRYGHFTLPMEEVLCTTAIDMRKSPHFEWRVPSCFVGLMGTYDCELVKEFFRALTISARLNLHVYIPYGENKHHISEAIYKSFGRSLSMAMEKTDSSVLFSTKDLLE